RDLHEKGDGLWESRYPPPEVAVPLGAARVHGEADGDALTIVSWANGLYMSLQAQRLLRAEGIAARVVDLRWLAPLPIDSVKAQARATGRVLFVDECRKTGGGPSAALIAELATDPDCRSVVARRVCGADSYVPLADAANLVLVQTADIVAAARELAAEPARGGLR